LLRFLSSQESLARVRELGGHVVPVADRRLLRQEMGGKSIYFAQEAPVENLGSERDESKNAGTACTPLVLFTGHPDCVADARAAGA
jgi:hypothetical protein